MKKDRFSVISESKFERLSLKELQEVKGDICWLCMKHQGRRRIHIGGKISGGATVHV